MNNVSKRNTGDSARKPLANAFEVDGNGQIQPGIGEKEMCGILEMSCLFGVGWWELLGEIQDKKM